jgi:hypothetical protein
LWQSKLQARAVRLLETGTYPWQVIRVVLHIQNRNSERKKKKTWLLQESLNFLKKKTKTVHKTAGSFMKTVNCLTVFFPGKISSFLHKEIEILFGV